MSSRPSKKPSLWYARLKPEQREAADFILERGSVALFSQQRTGKTYITMSVLEQLGWPRALIVAPLTSIDIVWVPALKQSGYTICRTLDQARGASGKCALVVHYQLFTKIAKRAAKLPWQVVVIDESQGLKARASGQSRAARRFRNAPRRLALSGTPIDEGKEIDIWAQMRFVNHQVLGEDWTTFANEYCYKTGFMGHKWAFNARMKKRFSEKLKPHVYRLTTGFLNLKPMNLSPVPFHLLGQQRHLYDTMKKDGVIEIDGSLITAPLEVTNKVKREQITGGTILDDDGNPHSTGRAKERKLRWLLGRLKPPVAIFCNFRQEMPIILKVLREFYSRVEELHGGVSRKDGVRTKIINDFQSGKLDALVCQLRTGGVAIDLTRASELIFYSINHSFIDFEQALFRLLGMNQKHELNAYVLCAVDTVDEEKMQVIENKKSAAYNIVSHFEPGGRK